MTAALPATDPASPPTPASDTPRPAASVVLLRDGDQGLEVLLMRRHQNSGVLGGLYVFPGGKLDAADTLPTWPHTLDLPPQALHERLAEPDTPAATALGLHVAALREMHEEAGVLVTEPAPGTGSADPQRLLAGLQAGTPWPQALADAGLRWRTRALQPWSRWITPRNPPVGTPRFDTRFFLALLPPGQQAVHDNHEATETLWLTPRAALAHYWAGEIGLVPPQLMGLAQLARHADSTSAWAEAQTRRPPCIQPEHFMDGPHRAMCYPGDPRHSVVERALPGPTRLRFVAQRFEPFDGYEGWFA